ncbi:hypothetical protein [Hansschlegelia zhihuaiae]|uniref:Uncharacterized protein n=1 Tax=Hansschlegelia zhihuaiae TaxID=405005 RepID=A0A4Q0MKX5_9HYPH|nr:hypothetical protein [Hansschlegelia zhihuaiae]RXF74123.1 hypothetical protein EK403_07055 [Hansschlegelia zhihuaiae]
MALRPGNLAVNQTDYTDYVDSMAAAMDEELNALLLLDDMPALNMDSSDRDVRARRRLFVAIARGVVRHLKDREDAFRITLPLTGSPVVTPDIEV